MEQAAKEGRPQLQTLPYDKGRAAVDKMSEDSEADPPEVAATIDGSDRRCRAARSATAAIGRSASSAGALPTLIYYHGGGFGDRQHRDARLDLPAAGQQEPLPGDLDRLSPGARASLPRLDRRCARGLPPHPRQRRRVRCRLRSASPSAAIRRAATISAVVCQACKQSGEAMPAFQMLIYPATDCAAAERIAQAVRRRLLPDAGADRLVLEGLHPRRHRPHRPAPVAAARRGRRAACRPPSC